MHGESSRYEVLLAGMKGFIKREDLRQKILSGLQAVSLKRCGIFLLVVVVLALSVGIGKSDRKSAELKIPAAPADLIIEQTDDGLIAKWNPSLGASSYTLFWGSEKGEFRRMFETKETAVLLKSLDTGKFYNFAVTASNSSFESSFSPEKFYVHDTDPTNVNEHMSLAKSLMEQDRNHEAMAYLAAAIRLDPKNAESYRTRASLFEKVGRRQEARKDLHMAETLFSKTQLTSTN